MNREDFLALEPICHKCDSKLVPDGERTIVRCPTCNWGYCMHTLIFAEPDERSGTLTRFFRHKQAAV